MSSPAKVPEAKPTSNHPAEEAQWKHVRAHIAKGNKATEKAEQHYVAAAQYLKGLKVAHDARGGTWEQWEITVKAKAGIGAPRASEIMQLGDGRKTLTGLRLSGAQREKRRRERNRISSSRDEEDGAPAAVPVAMAEPEPEHPADIIDQCVAGVVARIEIALGALPDADTKAMLYERLLPAIARAMPDDLLPVPLSHDPIADLYPNKIAIG